MANLDLLPSSEYVAQLPRTRTPAGLSRGDERSRAAGRAVPQAERGLSGGTMKGDKTPWMTAMRELDEDLGFVRTLSQLLVIERIPPDSDSLPERVAFVVDGSRIDDKDLDGLVFSPELASDQLCTAHDVRDRATPLLTNRLATCLVAVRSDATVVCQRAKRVV
ncbi:MAG TPA: hypothetical protein VGX25_02540 [Actinophytocola sp.]|uniref:hypothetical protein n=1 Tax=Actinophytocola sp. TaxID=1872138 RepID=UPI002DDD5A8D|nr:hypothetical protein [Actinophytocola sp.]HEV2778255.1 hypothetical protein [Actinophytocola sp.]